MNYQGAYKDKPNSRKTLFYRLENTSRQELYTSMYPNMLMDDMHLGIMPIGGRSRRPGFSISIKPQSKEVEGLIVKGFPSRMSYQADLTKAVCDFIDEESHALALFGKTYYEIVYFYSDRERTKIEGFILESLPPYCIKHALGMYWQFIPQEALKYIERHKKFVWLPKDYLLSISIPKELGGTKKHLKVLSDLQWLSKETIPEFAMNDMAEQNQTKGYDFLLYKSAQNVFLAKTSRHLGWTARNMFSDQSLEMYQIYRTMLFERSKAIIREHFLALMNKTLQVVGGKMGFQAEILIEGIPTRIDYDKYIKQLLGGTLQFSEAVKLMRI
ncbi:MAG: hypothetical protein WC500_04195 [Candidatus Margulisiibacteriota bacterium]